ncbi:hypothetical protein Y032_0137g1995 [Ancylostoma ceylanicum]|uniref:Uncharacterized protein n=1 Tax=Ancylostoma ceylanicum TaxID=53326 RepID=A0A016T4Y0_9BILA|nr:hypothetical protein Y032_0137g1995 [Ancylostoma ceylanicum]
MLPLRRVFLRRCWFRITFQCATFPLICGTALVFAAHLTFRSTSQIRRRELLHMKKAKQGFLNGRISCAFICTGIAIVFLSGQMWNHIRRPPFVTRDRTRETIYVYNSPEFQLVAETYIVAALYAAITFGFILLNEAATLRHGAEGRKKLDSRPFFSITNNLLSYIGIACVAIFSWVLHSVFQNKVRGTYYELDWW